ncbi:MAG: hypothetical protein IIA82_08045 [Thaumarchaeota archaeon]|nr:hypothetical protein [Nitrososphaerota archaeon]
MNPEKLKECVKIAKEAVKDESEPYKTEGYKIILEKLLNDTTENKKSSYNSKKESKDENAVLVTGIEKGKKELAKNCGISVNELEDAISISKNNDIEIIAPTTGSDSKKHIIVSLCVLAASEFLLKEEWIGPSKITECLRSIGVKDLGNLSLTLKRYPLLIRARGSRGKQKQYRLTTNEGRTKAFEIIRKLAKVEKIDV